MRYIKFIVYFFFGMLWFVSCEDEPVDWEAEDAPSKLVVEGTFTNEKKHHRVRLTQSADYFSNQRTPPVSGAQVAITGGDSTFLFAENSDEPGVYETVREVAGIPGNAYKLDIQLPEPVNGTVTYYAEEMMLQGIDVDSITPMVYENPFSADDDFVDSLILTIDILGSEPRDIDNFYRVDLYINGNLETDTIDEVQVFSDEEEFSNAYSNSLAFFKSVQPQDTVGIQVSSVSEDYAYFLEGVQNITNQSGSPFDLSGPPANAAGNIQGGDALGYFRVSYVSSASAIAMDMREKD